MSLEATKQLLNSLSQNELQECKQHINMLLAVKKHAPPNNGQGNDELLILDAIVQTLESLGVEFTSSTTLQHRNAYSAFKKKAPDLLRYVKHHTKTRNEARKLLRWGAEMLYRDLTQMGIAVSSSTIMNHIHRMPAVINKNMPGYATAGGIQWLLTKR